MKKVFMVIAIITCLTIGIGNVVTGATDTEEVNSALSQIQTELRANENLTDKEANRIMNRVRTQFNKMAKAGVSQADMNEVANQACNMIRTATKNAGDAKGLTVAVSLMAEEAIRGKDPKDVGDKLQEKLKDGAKLEEAAKQVRAEIRAQERTQTRTNQNAAKGGNGNGNGSGNSGGSGGSGGSGKSGGK